MADQSIADLNKAEETFNKGTALLNDSKYEEALQSFTSLINEEKFAPELFLQIGNAQYRLQNIGLAALSYRRALLLKSNLLEARQNLNLIKNKLGFVDSDPLNPSQVLVSSNESLIGTLLTISLWLIGIGAALLILKFRYKRSAITLLIIGSLCASSSAILSKVRDSFRPDPRTNIVIKNNTVARTAPAQSASTIIPLPPGSSVILVTVRDTWSYVKLPKELHGWIKTDSLESLWPYDPEFSD
ncbi:MAG: hypothetical protein VYB73_00175 [Verrucomicrobiota bacterium]|nr:hypothetical protein [Verrucomicrobiota bacterium]